MVIRSYRRVFDLERRIYRIDRLRLNPGGVPVRGIVYFIALLLLALALERMAPISLLARVVPWYVRDLALPGLFSAVLAVIRIEGRPFHLAARAVLGSGLGPRRIVGLGRGCRSAPAARAVWRPQPLLMLPDGSDHRMRRLPIEARARCSSPLRTSAGCAARAAREARAASATVPCASSTAWSVRRAARCVLLDRSARLSGLLMRAPIRFIIRQLRLRRRSRRRLGGVSRGAVVLPVARRGRQADALSRACSARWRRSRPTCRSCGARARAAESTGIGTAARMEWALTAAESRTRAGARLPT